tara:strand:+ start:352 stop:1110 length:759 start_codon:yes stop_codon:yes gene_type:complete
MKNKQLQAFYDQVYKNGSAEFFTVNCFEEARHIVGMGDWKDKEVLDIGCGEGALSVMIALAGAARVVGTDYSSQAIKKATSKFNIDNLNFIEGRYEDIVEKFDVITMEGVLEHFDSPWDVLENILNNHLREDGYIITSSPSFLNPRGYVWMTLLKLFDVPMSLTDLHFICPFDMKRFCDDRGLHMEYESIYQEWGSGDDMIRDLGKRLRNALRDADMDNSKVDDLLNWLVEAKEYFKTDNDSGAIVVYKISK